MQYTQYPSAWSLHFAMVSAALNGTAGFPGVTGEDVYCQ